MLKNNVLYVLNINCKDTFIFPFVVVSIKLLIRPCLKVIVFCKSFLVLLGWHSKQTLVGVFAQQITGGRYSSVRSLISSSEAPASHVLDHVFITVINSSFCPL